MTSFVERRIEVAVQLASGTGSTQPQTFTESGKDTLTVRDLRTSVRIHNSGAAAGSSATVQIWGLSPSLMNQLSTLGMVLQLIPRNRITITAGDLGGSMSTVFVGNILDAYTVYQGAPNVPFTFECQAGAAEQVIPFPASSFTGATDVATVLSAIATQNGWGFENNSVNVKLANPYFWGSAMQQVAAIKEAAQINAELINNVLCIWPRYGHRTAGGIPLVAPPPSGQMIGYPAFTKQGIMVKTIYDPRIQFGGQIKVESAVFNAQNLARIQNQSGTWNVYKLDHDLDALVPGGSWESTIYAYNPNFPAPIPPGGR